MILVTGGLGYIGSHLVVDLINDNQEVVILDNLSRSSIDVLENIKTLTEIQPLFYQGCISDVKILNKIMDNHPITHLIHLAGYKSVSESKRYPEMYFDNNVNKSIILFEELINKGLKNIIFSSSATVYAASDTLLTEESVTGPISTYGSSKLFVEMVLKKMFEMDSSLNISILRYFNPIGQHPSGLLQDTAPDNLYPNIKKALENNTELLIYGNDYQTPDGTCVRDFISIDELTKYHKVFLNKQGFDIFNVGTGIGRSVLQIIKEFPTLQYKFTDRRPGDSAQLVCSVEKLHQYIKNN